MYNWQQYYPRLIFLSLSRSLSVYIYIYIYIYFYIYILYKYNEMRFVILLPITGEKLLLKIPEKYYIFKSE